MEIRADRLAFKRSCCRKCGTVEGHLARYIQVNGNVACRWVCGNCGDHFTAGDLPKTWVRSLGVVLDDLPVCRDNRGTYVPPAQREQCVVCDLNANEFHHWAPRALFPTWPYELTVPLCSWHHHEWHHVMRAHGLRYAHELATA